MVLYALDGRRSAVARFCVELTPFAATMVATALPTIVNELKAEDLLTWVRREGESGERIGG